MGINKRQRYATLAFLKLDTRHGQPPVKVPGGVGVVACRGRLQPPVTETEYLEPDCLLPGHLRCLALDPPSGPGPLRVFPFRRSQIPRHLPCCIISGRRVIPTKAE